MRRTGRKTGTQESDRKRKKVWDMRKRLDGKSELFGREHLTLKCIKKAIFWKKISKMFFGVVGDYYKLQHKNDTIS